MNEPTRKLVSEATDDKTPVPIDGLLSEVLMLDHLEALRDHVAQLVAERQAPKARDFVDMIVKTLESALGGPPNPLIWMLRELRKSPTLYVDKFNVLLVGKLAESAARAFNLLDQGKVPSTLKQDAHTVCLSVAKGSKGKYRLLGQLSE